MSRNINAEFIEFYRLVSKGDDDALAFLLLWHEYCHQWDDLVDRFSPSPDQLLTTAALAIDLYSCVFYQRYVNELKPIAKGTTGTYLLSVLWEHDDEKWKRTCADVLRHAGCEMAYAVAEIVGGWAWRTQVMEVLANRVVLDRNEPD